MFKVDSLSPETIKTYGTPEFYDEYSGLRWITDVTEITCHDLDDGQIEIIALNGTPGLINPYQYSIDSTDTWSLGNIFGPLEDKKYIIAVQDSLGCIAYGDTIFLNNPDTKHFL